MNEAEDLMNQFEAEGLVVELVTPKVNTLSLAKKYPEAERWLASTPSHIYDAVYVLTSEAGYEKGKDVGCALRFIGQAFKHCKTIGALSTAGEFVSKATFGQASASAGVIMDAKDKKKSKGQKSSSAFIEALREHRHWSREESAKALPY